MHGQSLPHNSRSRPSRSRHRPANGSLKFFCGDTYVTLSGAYRLAAGEVPPQKNFSEQLAGLWRDLLGRDRLLWGSDWPCTNHESDANYAALRARLNDWLPETGDRQAALQTNPQRLYWR